MYIDKKDILEMLRNEIGRKGLVGSSISHITPFTAFVTKDAQGRLITDQNTILHPNFDVYSSPTSLPREGIDYDDLCKQIFFGHLTFSWDRSSYASLGGIFNFEVFNYFAKNPSLHRVNRNSYNPVVSFQNCVFSHAALYSSYGRLSFVGYMANVNNV